MYTIKEVADKMDVSEHTLRFWAKSGFFPFVKRDKNNIRMFSDNDLDWVYTSKNLLYFYLYCNIFIFNSK